MVHSPVGLTMHTWTAVWRRRSCKIPYFAESLKYHKMLCLFRFSKRDERSEKKEKKKKKKDLSARRLSNAVEGWKVHRHHLFSRVSDDYRNHTTNNRCSIKLSSTRLKRDDHREMISEFRLEKAARNNARLSIRKSIRDVQFVSIISNEMNSALRKLDCNDKLHSRTFAEWRM